MFKNHPRGLPVLFFTEMWERFGFYLMLGIFLLYLTASPDKGGLQIEYTTASDIFGTYIALVYLTPFIGGLLADRLFGYRKTIMAGGILMGLGYLALGIPRTGADMTFWIALVLIMLGNGLFKPNISTLVGNLYNDPHYAVHKDSGFNIFYMGINIGAFVCNFVAAFLRNKFGTFSVPFIAAGVGMFIGVVWFALGQKHTVSADVIKPAKPGDEPVSKILLKVFGPAIAFGLAGWFGIQLIFGTALFGSQSSDAFLFACIPVVFFYASLWFRSQGEDRERLGALLPIFAVVIVFWAIFHQNGAALTVWARDYTNREIPTALADAAGHLKLVETIESPAPDAPAEEVAKTYFHNLPKDLWPKETVPLRLVSTELFQSVNPFFVVFLTPLVVGVFAFLRRRGKEPSTPGKIALGLFITALSTLVMTGATFATHNGAEKASALWLIATYGIITTGELCLSPMGLSLVSKVSPPRLTAVLTGGWFLSTSIGNKLSGILSGLMGSFEHKSGIFLINFAGALTATVLIVLMLPHLKKVIAKYTIIVPEAQNSEAAAAAVPSENSAVQPASEKKLPDSTGSDTGAPSDSGNSVSA